jgi:hypothetical protein
MFTKATIEQKIQFYNQSYFGKEKQNMFLNDFKEARLSYKQFMSSN